MIKYSFLTVGILALAACGSGENDSGGGVVGSLVKSKLSAQVAARKASKSGAKPAATKPFTMADASKVKAKLIRIAVPKYNSSSLATMRANNSGYRTFATSGGQTVTLKGQSVTATRGLQNDLVARSLGSKERVYKHMNDLNHLTKQVFNCESSRLGAEKVQILDRNYTLTRIEEICRNNVMGFKNVTWVSGSGVPRKSQQWISQEIGHITIEWLN